MNSNQEKESLNSSTHEIVHAYYTYLFHLDDDYLEAIGLQRFNKQYAIQAFPELVPLFSEGEPSIFPTPARPEMNPDDDKQYGGPNGYEVNLLWVNRRRGRHWKRHGIKFCLYYDGSAYRQLIEVDQFPKPISIFTEKENKDNQLEESILPKDIPQLRSVIHHIQNIYVTVFDGPGFRSRQYLESLETNLGL